MKKEQFLLSYRNSVMILLLMVAMFTGMELPIYASENEEIKQLEIERQQTLEMIEGLKSSINSVQEDIDDLTIEKASNFCGNHLHFGIIKNGTYVDPLGYISN